MTSLPKQPPKSSHSIAEETVRVVIIGGAGNVGKGIWQACCSRSWIAIGIDPAFQEVSAAEKSKEVTKHRSHRMKSTIEDIDDETFQSWFVAKHIEFIVTNDDGNREHYDNDPKLGTHNDGRFKLLMARIAAAKQQSINGQVQEGIRNISVHVSYIGGSWTRREAQNDFEINEASTVKPGGGSNAYERAKSNAERNARNLSNQYSIAVSFYDYISIVPNYAPNFSVNRMTMSAHEQGVIKFSAGDYGRPLCHASEAGEFVMAIIETQIASKGEGIPYDCDDVYFESILVPGHFITFETFAFIAREAAEQFFDDSDKQILLEKFIDTPDELRYRCVSSRKSFCSHSMVIAGLKETAIYYAKLAAGIVPYRRF